MGESRSGRWKLPEGEEPWKLGRQYNWKALEDFLDSHRLDDFYAEDPSSERSLAELRTIFDDSRNARGGGFAHAFVDQLGGDNASLLKRVLALGIEPDREDDRRWRPSHTLSRSGRVECAKAIAACRPNLTAKNGDNEAPRATADIIYGFSPGPQQLSEAQLKTRGPLVRAVWEEMEASGFPSLAKMAAERKWWAVKNLCRRRAVRPEEVLTEKHDGKTAIEWAEAHSELRLAEELRYLFRLELMNKKLVEDTVAAELASLRTLVNDLIIQNDEKDRSRPEPAAPSVPDAVKEYMSQLGAQVAEIEGKLEEKERSFSREMESLRTEVKEKVSSNASAGAADNRRSGRKRDESTQPRAGDKNMDQIASFAMKRVDALARTSPEFLARIFELLDEYEA